MWNSWGANYCINFEKNFVNVNPFILLLRLSSEGTEKGKQMMVYLDMRLQTNFLASDPKQVSCQIYPILAFTRQHTYRPRFNAFAGNNHIFQMALFFTTICTAAIGTNGLAIILY